MSAATAIELLGWLPKTHRLEASLKAAFETAKRAAKDEVAVEHFLAALLEDVDAAVYFATRGVEIERLRTFCRQKIGEAAMPQPAVLNMEPAAETAPAPKADAPAQPQPSAPFGSPRQTAAPLDGLSAAHAALRSAASEPHARSGYRLGDSSESYSRNGGYDNGYGAAARPTNGHDADHGVDRDRFRSDYDRQDGYGGSNVRLGATPSYHYSPPAPGASHTNSAGAADPTRPAPAAQTAPEKRPPAPSRGLRRLMAQASELAELAGADEVNSELAVRAIALDETSDAGQALRAQLSEKERLSLRPKTAHELEAEASRARQTAEMARIAKQAQNAVASEPAFASIVNRSENVMTLLQDELQKDRRYRIANDLAAFVTSREPEELMTGEGVNLGESALPILRATRDELLRDPQFRAFEQVRTSLKIIKGEQAQVHHALALLTADNAQLSKAVHSLIVLQRPAAETESGEQPALNVEFEEPPLAIEDQRDRQVMADPAEIIHDEASLHALAMHVRRPEPEPEVVAQEAPFVEEPRRGFGIRNMFARLTPDFGWAATRDRQMAGMNGQSELVRR
ncbi:MAG: hypothetical protein MRY74_06520 [Neomegalonema sp.]|nr:hypothetical protein [Neomegalonema sp.]